jgi:hypothetical protein
MAAYTLLLAAFFLVCAHHLWAKRDHLMAFLPLSIAGYILWHSFPVTHAICARMLIILGLSPGAFWQLCGAVLFLLFAMIGLRCIFGAARLR